MNRPMEWFLPIFNTNVASVLRLSNKGRITVGGDADLVVLDHTCSVDAVMAGGEWLVRGGRPMRLGTFEQRAKVNQ